MKFEYRYPNGGTKALTFSYDDGPAQDRRLVDLFNRYGMKGTFHLNSGWMPPELPPDVPKRKDGYPDIRVSAGEAPVLYQGHEISCHGKFHATFRCVPPSVIAEDIFEDRIVLEKIAGYPVYGMSYPNGHLWSCTDEIISLLRSLGIVYSRTTAATHSFALPEDFMRWNPTAHHCRDGAISEIGKRFLDAKEWGQLQLCYIWGHSFEFDSADNWNVIEDFCAQMAHRDFIWYAANMEIYEYIQACRRLILAADNSLAYNPSAISVHGVMDGAPVEIRSGERCVFR